MGWNLEEDLFPVLIKFQKKITWYEEIRS